MKIVNTGSYRKLNLILEEFIALLKSAEDTSQSPITKSIHAHVWSSLLPWLSYPGPNLQSGCWHFLLFPRGYWNPLAISLFCGTRHLRMILLCTEGHVLHLTMSLIKKKIQEEERKQHLSNMVHQWYFLQNILIKRGNVRAFLSKMELEDRKWRMSHMCLQKNRT